MDSVNRKIHDLFLYGKCHIGNKAIQEHVEALLERLNIDYAITIESVHYETIVLVNENSIQIKGVYRVNGMIVMSDVEVLNGTVLILMVTGRGEHIFYRMDNSGSIYLGKKYTLTERRFQRMIEKGKFAVSLFKFSEGGLIMGLLIPSAVVIICFLTGVMYGKRLEREYGEHEKDANQFHGKCIVVCDSKFEAERITRTRVRLQCLSDSGHDVECVVHHIDTNNDGIKYFDY
ncbi:hypothetical protein FF38_11038 [Lucilia cuprina]|uniref:Uncharacterized protein n=1 Tax=Lucilia cuprina TaxID=7375 RepID=A0A0L0C1Z5_LUCCU|nr:hypothetical protein FF38_11038 [Lucilia cuprina]